MKIARDYLHQRCCAAAQYRAGTSDPCSALSGADRAHAGDLLLRHGDVVFVLPARQGVGVTENHVSRRI